MNNSGKKNVGFQHLVFPAYVLQLQFKVPSLAIIILSNSSGYNSAINPD